MLLLAAGCSGVGASDQEPVGVVLEASGAVPALEMALTVVPPSAAQQFVAPLTGALHAALTSCATRGFAALDAGLSLAFELHAGRARAQREQRAALARCLSSTLANSSWAGMAQVQSFALRLRAAHARARAERSAAHDR